MTSRRGVAQPGRALGSGPRSLRLNSPTFFEFPQKNAVFLSVMVSRGQAFSGVFGVKSLC